MPAPNPVDAYIAALPADRRDSMEALRRSARDAAPDAEEVISYSMPALRLDGRFLVSYDAFARHYSLFPASEAVQTALGDEVARYVAGKGTFRFPSAEPIPVELVGRIVRARVAELRGGDAPAAGRVTGRS